MKKNPIDSLVIEWAYRCKKGYPDINNLEDKKVLEKIMKEWNLEEQEEGKEVPSVEQIKKLLDNNKDNARLLTRIYRTLIASSSIDSLKGRFRETGIDKDIFDGRNLHDELINILQKGDSSEVEQFIEDLKKKKVLGTQGNLTADLRISSQKVNKIVNLTGAKGSVTIGKGEVIFPLLYSNVELKTDGAGDFIVDKKTAELKSTLGRLAGTRTVPRYTPMNSIGKGSFVKAFEGDAASANITGTVEEVIDNMNKYIESNFPKTSIRFQENDLEDPVEVVVLAAIDNYIKEKTIDMYIILDTTNLDYRVYNPAEKLLDSIKNGEINYDRSGIQLKSGNLFK